MPTPTASRGNKMELSYADATARCLLFSYSDVKILPIAGQHTDLIGGMRGHLQNVVAGVLIALHEDDAVFGDRDVPADVAKLWDAAGAFPLDLREVL